MRAGTNSYRAPVKGGLWLACALSAVLVLCVPGTARAQPSFYGVIPINAPTAAEVQMMADGGVGTIRLNFLWHQVQPTEGADMDWTAIDPVVVLAAQSGVKVLPVLVGSPEWAVNCANLDPRFICNRVPPVRTAEGRQGWRAFVRAAAERYGPGGSFWAEHSELSPVPIRTWVAWNEVNSKNFWPPKPSPRQYKKLLTITHEEISDAISGAQVVHAGMFGTPPGPTAWGYLRKLYRLGGTKRLFDGVALHPFASKISEMVYQVSKVRRVMKDRRDAKTGIWITELGWASSKGNHYLEVGRKGQRRMLRRSFRVIEDRRRSWKVKRVFWFAWRDSPEAKDICRFCATSGLVEDDLSPKPAWYAFKRFALD